MHVLLALWSALPAQVDDVLVEAKKTLLNGTIEGLFLFVLLAAVIALYLRGERRNDQIVKIAIQNMETVTELRAAIRENRAVLEWAFGRSTPPQFAPPPPQRPTESAIGLYRGGLGP